MILFLFFFNKKTVERIEHENTGESPDEKNLVWRAKNEKVIDKPWKALCPFFMRCHVLFSFPSTQVFKVQNFSIGPWGKRAEAMCKISQGLSYTAQRKKGKLNITEKFGGCLYLLAAY